MKKKLLAIIAVLSIAALGTAGSTANAQDGAQAKAGLHATVTPATPASFATVTAKLSGAAPRTSYYCVLTTWHAGISGGASLADSTSIVTVKTNRAGKATCHQTFRPFHGTWQGHTHSCPPSRADKRSGWKCGVGFANANQLSQRTTALFRF